MNKEAKVKFNEESPEPAEILASAIISISEAFKKIEQSRLTRRALVVLIKDHCGVTQKEINLVLDSVAHLKEVYTKGVKAKK